MIYAIEAVGTRFIKFGRATSVGKRLREIETGCPHDLHILAVADWHDGLERAVHRYLEQDCERREWFRKSRRTEAIVSFMLQGLQGMELFIDICRQLRIIEAHRERREILKARVAPTIHALEAPVVDPGVFESIKQKALARRLRKEMVNGSS